MTHPLLKLKYFVLCTAHIMSFAAKLMANIASTLSSLAVIRNVFCYSAMPIHNIDDKSHKSKLRNYLPIIRSPNHATSYLWPRSGHTYALHESNFKKPGAKT